MSDGTNDHVEHVFLDLKVGNLLSIINLMKTEPVSVLNVSNTTSCSPVRRLSDEHYQVIVQVFWRALHSQPFSIHASHFRCRRNSVIVSQIAFEGPHGCTNDLCHTSVRPPFCGAGVISLS